MKGSKVEGYLSHHRLFEISRQIIIEIIAHLHYPVSMVNLSEIKSVAKRIGRAINADAVILFGSYARDEANENSDVDFLVVAESNLPRYKRSRKLYKLIKPHPFGMDILVYTPEEIKRNRKSKLSFISSVLREGKTLYERGN